MGIVVKVLLTTPPGKTTEKWPPLGLLYIASNLRARRRDELIVLDAFCENLSIEQLVSRIVDARPDVLGINCSTHTFLDTMSVMNRVKMELPGTIMVLGGYHATFTSERILRSYPFIDQEPWTTASKDLLYHVANRLYDPLRVLHHYLRYQARVWVVSTLSRFFSSPPVRDC